MMRTPLTVQARSSAPSFAGPANSQRGAARLVLVTCAVAALSLFGCKDSDDPPPFFSRFPDLENDGYDVDALGCNPSAVEFGGGGGG
ncbi:MAG: hypothetical protein ACI81R_002857, partial [Bradymonadia bacterium]